MNSRESAALDARVKALCQANRVIDAIKEVRAFMGIGLKEAKDYVDKIRGYQP
jgi:ribosomal protein L7/L12